MEAYYYSKMNKTHQNVYHVMKTGLTALNTAIMLPMVDGKELQEIFFQLRLDCPEIFYGIGCRYRYAVAGSHIEMIPEYLFSKKKVKEHQQALKSRISKVIRPAEFMAEYHKEQYIHDFICTSIRYDKLKKAYSHEIIGPLGHGVGVCEGIAKTVKILCDNLGIWCMIAISEANPDKKIKYRHAWNIVRIDGVHYHLDATFDNTLSHNGEIRYDYFNLDDKQIFKDHEPVIYDVPQCSDGSRSYYREKKTSLTRMEDVSKRALQAIRKGNPFIFHWRGGYLTHEVLAELLGLLEQTARKKDRHAVVSLNLRQAVLHVNFSDKVSDKEFVLEEANEGEAL